MQREKDQKQIELSEKIERKALVVVANESLLFGYGNPPNKHQQTTIHLEDVLCLETAASRQAAIYAAEGPAESDCISATIPMMLLYNVSMVAEATPAAVAAWIAAKMRRDKNYIPMKTRFS